MDRAETIKVVHGVKRTGSINSGINIRRKKMKQMNITNEEWERFYSLRQRVFDLIRKEDDGIHKSYEGAMDVRMSYWDIYRSKDIKDISFVEIELHCYLLLNKRHRTFSGETFTLAMDDLERWLKNMELMNDMP